MKQAIRKLFCEPTVVDGCLCLHYAVFVTEKAYKDAEPTKYETVVSQPGPFSIGSISQLYDNSFPMLSGRKRLIDEFLNQKRTKRATSRNTVKGEIAATMRGQELENVRELPVEPPTPRPKKAWKQA